jgi:hypothetical protein
VSGEYARRRIGIKGPITGLILIAIVAYATYWGWNEAFRDEPTAGPTLGCPTTTVATTTPGGTPTGTATATGTTAAGTTAAGTTAPATGGPTTEPGPSGVPSANPLQLLPSGITVNVFNATDRRGLAANTASGLRDLGFNIGEVGNSAQPIATFAEIHASAADDPQVLLLLQYVPGATVIPDRRPDATVDLVIGDDFQTVTAPTSLTPVLLPTTPPC